MSVSPDVVSNPGAAAGPPLHVLVTGAFGNLGRATIRELLARGDRVRCFDVPSPPNRRVARGFGDRVEVLWGDIRDADQVAAAVAGQNAVIHNAAILPPPCELRPDLSRAVNVDGTRHILAAMAASDRRPVLVFTSSISVFGPSPDREPPVRSDSPVCATDNYTTHKLECESLIRASGVPAVVLRVGVSIDPASLAGDMGALRMMFEVDPGTRLEFVHPADVARAQVNAIRCREAQGKVLLIGGGENCRIRHRDLFASFCDALGVRRLPDEAFGTSAFYTDWMDTEESQRLLRFQSQSFDDYRREMTRNVRWLRILLLPLRPLVRAYLLRQSRPWRECRVPASARP